MTDSITDIDASDVVVVRGGELSPEITEPTIIGSIVRIPAGVELADAIRLASTVIPSADRTEVMRVIVTGPDELAEMD